MAPLAWLPEVWTYALLAGMEIAALVVSIVLLRRLAPFRDMRDAMSQGAVLSRRATGFGEVIAHDGIVPAQYMGGPVVDSGGHVVGVNIARADRMKTYALPARRVRASLEAMLARVKAGDVLPPEDPRRQTGTVGLIVALAALAFTFALRRSAL